MLFVIIFSFIFFFLFIFLQTLLFSPCYFVRQTFYWKRKTTFCIQQDFYCVYLNGMNFNGRKFHVLLFNYCILQFYSYRRNGWQCLTFDSIPSSVFKFLVFFFYHFIFISIRERRTSNTLNRTHTKPMLLFFIYNNNNNSFQIQIMKNLEKLFIVIYQTLNTNFWHKIWNFMCFEWLMPVESVCIWSKWYV